MPIVKIDLWKGRDKQIKKELIEKVTTVISEVVGCPAEAVHIIINDIDKDNWGIGGDLSSEKFPDK